MYENFDIVGPFSVGPEIPQPMYRPISAVSPAGPVSVEWPSETYRQVQPAFGFAPGDLPANIPWWQSLINAFRPGPIYPPDYTPTYIPPPDIPTYRAETACPICPSVWPWVLGAAAIGLLLGQGGRK